MNWYWWVVPALLVLYFLATAFLVFVAVSLGDRLDKSTVAECAKWPLYLLLRLFGR